jgi:hypothetical protein
VSKGLVQPLYEVGKGTSMDRLSYISLALGLNYESTSSTDPTDRPCFKFFSHECLQLFRDAANVNSYHREPEMAILLGKCLSDDRKSCLNIG